MVISLYYARIGWNGPLLGIWSFRETQTALSTRDILENGFRIAYATPVLGAPWSIPFEFPTYQFLVALLVKLTGLPLEQAGRTVSLIFSHGAAVWLGVFIARASRSRAAGIYAAAFTVISPLYLFGSRSFMIESTALFFAVGFLHFVQEFLLRPRWTVLLGALLVGSLAGPTKATTFAIALAGVSGLVLLHGRAILPRLRETGRPVSMAAGFVAAVSVPVLLALWWTHYTDELKSRNELAGFITSSALHDWNFGTWAQRGDLQVWRRIWRVTNDEVLGLPTAWIAGIVAVVMACRTQRIAWVLLVMTGAGAAVFTNLYFIHNYYQLASGIYLLAVFAVGIGALWERAGNIGRALGGLVLAPAIAACLLTGYVRLTLPRQLATFPELLEIASVIERQTPPDSVVLVYGIDWSSALPYYAHRRALINRHNHSLTNPIMQRALARLDHPIGAITFCGAWRSDAFSITEQLSILHALGARVYSGAFGEVYLASPPHPAAWPSPIPGLAEIGAKAESAFGTHPVNFHGGSGMFVHAPGEMTLPRNASQQFLRTGYGIYEPAFTGEKKTDGISFIIDFVDSAGNSERLYARRVDPAGNPDDRISHYIELPLPPNRAGTLHFRAEPGEGSAFDWAIWHDVQLL